MTHRGNESGQAAAISTVVITVCIALLVGMIFLWIGTAEWRKDINGKAKLAEARNASKVKTERARAAFESSKLDAKRDLTIAVGNAKAEVARARGTAEAVRIENGAITNTYIKYLYVKNIRRGQVIYVPTEAGLPILEAGHRN